MAEKPPNPQLEYGYTQIANELIEALARTVLTASQSRVMWAMIREIYGWHTKSRHVSATVLQRLTGMDRRNCWRAVNTLIECKMLSVISDASKTRKFSIQKNYWEWKTYCQSRRPPRPSVISDAVSAKPDAVDSVKPDAVDSVKPDAVDSVISDAPLKKERKLKQAKQREGGGVSADTPADNTHGTPPLSQVVVKCVDYKIEEDYDVDMEWLFELGAGQHISTIQLGMISQFPRRRIILAWCWVAELERKGQLKSTPGRALLWGLQNGKEAPVPGRKGDGEVKKKKIDPVDEAINRLVSGNIVVFKHLPDMRFVYQGSGYLEVEGEDNGCSFKHMYAECDEYEVLDGKEA